MSTLDTENPFSLHFNLLKIRYHDYDSTIDDKNFINKDSKINVFISFESIMNMISTVKDLDNRLLLKRDFPTILESEMLNICAHYKKFFRSNNLDTKVYLYMTDLSSDNFKEFKYNNEYRSFYINKFLNNPFYALFGNKLNETVIPRVKTISDFIPNVYVVTSKNIDGSLIPLIIANNDPERKNFIVTTDKFETQYMFMDNFTVHYIKRGFNGTTILPFFKIYMMDIFKATPDEIELYKNITFYSLLLSVLGDKLRCIDSIKGVGIKTITKYIINGINDNKITSETDNLKLILDIIPDDIRELCENNFKCINIYQKYNELTDKDKFDIINQLNDRFDNDSLIKLNNEYYTNYPLMLPELTC